MKRAIFLVVAVFCLGVREGKAQYTDLLNFNGVSNPQGSSPFGSLTLLNNKMYGMAYYGGANNDGCIFSINTNGTGFKDIFDFNWTDGALPSGNLILSGRVLYGMTWGGNIYGDAGVVFSIDTDGSRYNILHNFKGGSDGNNPNGSLALSGNVLYGMTTYGGDSNYGCIFSIDTNGSGYSILNNFNGINGKYPKGSLTVCGNLLFGMTEYGGSHDSGCIFSIHTNGSAFRDIFNFNGANGELPFGSLIQNGKLLYGMTSSGGAYYDGCIFSIDTNGSLYRDVHDFNGANGSFPRGSLLLFGEKLYGMTEQGGTPNVGVIFSIDTSGADFDELSDFYLTNDGYPWGDLTYSGGRLYGMTNIGGLDGNGSVFCFNTCTLQDSIKKVNITCHGANDGKRKVFPYGGVPPYTYLWSDGNTKEGMSSLSAGTYSCIVTDNNGCSVTAAETIIDPLALSVSLSSSAVKCFGGNTGSATVTSLTGGTPPYTYLWAPPGVTSATLTGASAGTYTLTVHDRNGCSVTSTVRVTQPSKIRDSITAVGCGTATVGVRGGTPAYNYRWTPYGGFTATAIVYTVGIYTVTITDRNGCTASTTANIICPSALKHKEEVTGNGDDNATCCDKDIIVYPNPNNGIFNVICHSAAITGSLPIMEIYNVLGQRIFREAHSLENGYLINLSTQPSGIYMYLIKEANGNLLGEGKIMVQK